MKCRPVFIVGCPRSGTTLLRDLLCSHPRLTIPPESQFIPRYYRAFGDPASDEAAWRLGRRILAAPHMVSWGISGEARDFAGLRSFGEVAGRVFELWAAKQGKPRWGDKTPHYVCDLPLLRRLFPEAQVIHIVRDGRDVALSWLRAGIEPQNLYMAARMWRQMVTVGRRDGVQLPAGAYLEIRYEALLAEAETTLRGVCAFLNKAFDPAVLRPTRLAADAGWWKPKRSPAFETGIVTDNTGKWTSTMSLRERSLFESVAAGLLGELGYPVEGLGRTLSRPETWFWEADHTWRHATGIFRRLEYKYWRQTALAYCWARVCSILGRRHT